jgi:hypothetical protein
MHISRFTQIKSHIDKESPRANSICSLSYLFQAAPISFNLHSYLSLVRVMHISRFTQINFHTSDAYHLLYHEIPRV